MRRGVVSLPCELYLTEQKKIRMDRCLGKVDMNYFALYWDDLVIPRNNILAFGVEGEEELIDRGFLIRPSFEIKGNISSEVIFQGYCQAQREKLKDLRRTKRSTHWQLANIGTEIGNLASEIRVNTFKIELSAALPVPRGDVSLDDIFRFKNSFDPEKQALYHYLDEVYKEVKNSADFDLARARAFYELEKAILDLNKAVSSRWRSPIKFDFSGLSECTLDDMKNAHDFLNGISGYLAASHGSWLGAAVPIATSLAWPILGKIKVMVQNPKIDGNEGIAYLAKANKEGFY